MISKQFIVLPLALIVFSASLQARQGNTRLDVESARIGKDTAELKVQVQAVRVEGFLVDPIERLVDARLHMSLQRWDEAATLLYSLLDPGTFSSRDQGREVKFLLAVCLFEMKNIEGAREYFEQLVNEGYQAAESLLYLVDIASDLDRSSDLKRYISLSMRLGSDAVPSRDLGILLYARGKAQYLTGDHTSSSATMADIPADDAYWARGRYFQAVSLVSRGLYSQALPVFQEVATRAMDTGDERLWEMANLSMARLSLEEGLFARAVGYYNNMPQDSARYPRSVYELTHLYIAEGESRDDREQKMASYRKALQLLEVLTSFEDLGVKMSIETSVLRGRINFFLGMMDFAREAYQDVVSRYAPMAAELWEYSGREELVSEWFKSIMHHSANPILQRELLSEDASSWVKEDPALGQLLNLMEDVSSQKAYLFEAEDSLSKLKVALQQPNPRNLFPQLRDGWFAAVELENRLIYLNSQLIDQQKRDYGALLSGAELESEKRLNARRLDLMRRFDSAPVTAEAYGARDKVAMQLLKEVEKDLDEQLLRLERSKEEADAMLRILREVKYKGSLDLQVHDEEGIRREIDAEIAILAELFQQAFDAKMVVQREMITGGVVEESELAEGSIRAVLWNTLQAQSGLMLEVASRGSALNVQEKVELQSQINLHLQNIQEVRKLIDSRALARVQYFAGILEEERRVLEQNRTQIAKMEQKVFELARVMGTPLFRLADERLSKVVLDAELGLVDIAWMRKQALTDEREELANEQGDAISLLRRELALIKEEVE